jgi:hypothetical protein
MTIKEKVTAAAVELQAMATSLELKMWSYKHGMNSAAGFANFKKALLTIGINYDELRDSAKPKANYLAEVATHRVTLYSDYKQRGEKFAVCNEDGGVLWYGRLFEGDTEQSSGELAAALKAVWLAGQIRQAVNAEAIELELRVDAQYLTYQDNPKQKGFRLTEAARRQNVALSVVWVPGTQNPADKYTVAHGFKKWQDNDLYTLAQKKEVLCAQ